MKLIDLLKVIMIDDYSVFLTIPELALTGVENTLIYDYRVDGDNREKLRNYLDYRVVAISEEDNQIIITIKGLRII